MSVSQCDRVMAVLRDQRPHTMVEIHERAGFMRLNSRISDLRAKGHTIRCWREGDQYLYQLDAGPGLLRGAENGRRRPSRCPGPPPGFSAPRSEPAQLALEVPAARELWA